MTATVRAARRTRVHAVEWATLSLIAGCYAGWLAALFLLFPVSPVLAILTTAVAVALHASLTHEVLHGHPFRSTFWNEAMMRLPLNLVIPYCRFRDLHLAHHRDANLTDPYDDPETNYLDPVVWARLPGWLRLVYRFNNTLLGRMLVGPAIGQATFFRDEWRLIRAGDLHVRAAWAMHLVGAGFVLWIVAVSAMPVWAYLVACYLGLSLLRIRTFLEHQAHEKVRGRTVIIEDRGPLALLFLNNNLHVVHHMHPGVPWYALPRLYRQGRDRFLKVNQGYSYASYGAVFRAHFLTSKDPVAHPLWRNR